MATASSATRITPVQAAKTLGIRPQIVYGFIRSGRLGTFPNPSGKTALVELAAVEGLTTSVRHHREKDPTTGKPIRRTPEGVERGTLLSYHAEFPSTKKTRKRHAHRVVVVDEVVKDDDGQAALIITRRSETGDQGIIYEAEGLADSLAKGKCHIESPEALLGALMFHFANNSRPDLTTSLWNWATMNGLDPVNINLTAPEVEINTIEEPPRNDPNDIDSVESIVYNTPED